MVQSNRLGKHSVVRHLSMKRRKKGANSSCTITEQQDGVEGQKRQQLSRVMKEIGDEHGMSKEEVQVEGRKEEIKVTERAEIRTPELNRTEGG